VTPLEGALAFCSKIKLVFIHGWATDSRVWSRQVDEFSKDHECLLVNLPGYSSGTEWHEPTLKPAVDNLLSAIGEDKGEIDLIGIGWSLGAQVLLKTATIKPELFHRLVLVSATPCFIQKDDFPWGQPPATARKMAIDIKKALSETLERFYSLNFTKQELKMKLASDFIKSYSKFCKYLNKNSISVSLATLINTDLRNSLEKIRTPSLVVHGEDDQVVPAAAGGFLADNIPGARFELFKDTGHIPFLTKAVEFNGILRGFCMNNKRISERVKRSFSRAAPNYDNTADLQKDVADELLQKIPGFIAGRPHLTSILDIGCGTGFMTFGLNNIFPSANIVGCDIAHPMIEIAKQKRARNEIKFISADAGDLPFVEDTFDMVASNLTYQWLPDLNRAFSEVFRVLQPGGVFVFSILGPGTLRELKSSYHDACKLSGRDGLPSFIDFPEPTHIAITLERTGFKYQFIESYFKRRYYDSLWGLLKILKSIGAANPYTQGDKSLARGGILKQMAEIYWDKFCIVESKSEEDDLKSIAGNTKSSSKNQVYASYNVLLIKTIKS
jgi:malonyl-ACP O-methyltransferase BioC/pimeloyl-ACP methyl ester esterase